jgi:ubiquinone/menaquinone biosynthesis C-methylase UbiE
VKHFHDYESVCPWWLGSALNNPVRRLFHKPESMLRSLVSPGDTVADIGCGSGFFTLPLARLVGDQGRVIAIDVQDEMLAGVHRRAEQAGLLPRLQFQNAILVEPKTAILVDFALAFWMVHEVPDQTAFFRQVHALLKPGAKLLVAEPKIHVGEAAFRRSLQIAQSAGLTPVGEVKISLSRAMVFEKTESVP